MKSTSTPKKILLVRLSALGDVIQTLPILPMVRRTYPDATIGWAIDAELVSAIDGHPDVDNIHVCHRKRWMRSLKDPSQWASWLNVFKEMRAFINEMKAVGYDTVIDLQGLFKTALISYLTGVKRRIGFAHGRELTGLFYNEKYLSNDEYFDPEVFHLEHMKTLSMAIGCPDAELKIEPPPIPKATEAKILLILEQAFRSKEPIVSIAPGTQWDTKLWPIGYWIDLIKHILLDTTMNIVLIGSKQDAALVCQILEGVEQAVDKELIEGRVLNVSGTTSIPEIYAIYRHSHIAIGSDSAPLHIAGAMQTPHLVGIYGPTGYMRTPPIGSRDIKLFTTKEQLPCQPCHKKTCRLGTTECMTAIQPAEVFQHVANCSH